MNGNIGFATTEGYVDALANNVEVLFNAETKETLVSEGTNMGLRQAWDLMPGCTHILLRTEGRFSFYKAEEEIENGQRVYGWMHLDQTDHDNEIPPELKAFQMIL